MNSQTYRVPNTVMSRALGDEAVILDLESGTYYGLNEVGSRIWQVVSAGGTVEGAAKTVAAEFQVSPPEALADARALVDDLARQGLLAPA